MLELNFSGNHLRGSRPIISFDAGFDGDNSPHWKLMKEMLTQIFATPRFHKRSKPFVDHVITFSRLDDCVWLRNYQIAEETLIEVGPRLVLKPVQIFEGSLRGATLWKNPNFVPPNLERRELQKEKDEATVASRKKTKKGKEVMRKWKIPASQIDEVLQVAGDVGDVEDMLDIVEDY